jgi:hypothetical protein
MRQLFILILSLQSFILFASSDGIERSSDDSHVDDKEVVSFIYHRFGDDRYPTTNTSVENLEAHINYLKK